MILYPFFPNKWNLPLIDWNHESNTNANFLIAKKFAFDMEHILCALCKNKMYVTSDSRFLMGNPETIYTIASHHTLLSYENQLFFVRN
jgi:hypothetical protein